jgi:carboxypeptidase C (cathepsin A)
MSTARNQDATVRTSLAHNRQPAADLPTFMQQVMALNVDLKVLSANGYLDSVAPFLADHDRSSGSRSRTPPRAAT